MANPTQQPESGGFLTGASRYLERAEVRPVGGVGANSAQFRQGWWFEPMAPTTPLAPAGQQPRRFEYTPGHNLLWTPRDGVGISFNVLRQLSYMLDVLRVVIEEAKSGLRSLEWEIRPKRNPGETDRDLSRRAGADKVAARIREFLEYPDGEQSWDAWLNAFLEDMYVIDAASILLERDSKNRVARLRLVDGATISPLVTVEGWTPRPPAPAYYQVLYGAPGFLLTTNDLLYCPFNRVNRGGHNDLSLYGYPPVEFVLLTVNQLLRNEAFNLAFFTEGNVPEAIAGVPASWTPKQVEELQGWWDSMEKGNLGARRKVRFIPTVQAAGGERMNIVFPKVNPASFQVQYPELLITIICAAFRITKQTFLKMQNRATARVEKETAQEVGHFSARRHVENTINLIIQQKMGQPGYEFAFRHHLETDAVKRMQVAVGYVKSGVLTLNEVRDDLGMVPYSFDQADESLFMTPTGVIPLSLGPESLNPGSGRVAAPEDAAPASLPEPGPGRRALPPAPRPPQVGNAPAKKRSASRIDPTRTSPLMTAAASRIKRAFVAANRAYAARLIEALKPHFGAQKATKPDKPKIPAWLEDLLAALGLPYGAYQDDIRQSLEEASSAGVSDALPDSDLDATAQREQFTSAAAWADAHAAELVTEIGETTRNELRQIIVGALSEETQWPELVERIENAGAFSAARAELIAYTETGNAMVRAALETWKAGGVVRYIRWETAEDERVCPVCAMNDNSVRPIGEAFPSGDESPLSHPRCRCVLVASDSAGDLPTLAAVAKGLGKGKVYLMRHGATLFNEQQRIRGQSGIPLDAAGRRTVAESARSLDGAGITKIVSSNVRRARESANLTSHILGVPVTTDARLNAWDTGKLTGKERDGSGLDAYIADPDQAPPGGESLNDFKKRALAGVKDALKESRTCGPLLVVTHNSVLLAVRDDLQGRDAKAEAEDPVPPGGVALLAGGKLKPIAAAKTAVC